MSTIFGAPWSDLTLDDVRAYLDQADDEPLLWEAKGTRLDAKEVRRQVCAFANSHEGGYLILGAEPEQAGSKHRWVLDGVSFPDEPRTWISNVIADLEVGVRPRPDFDVVPWEAPNGHVAVVRVMPTSTPPCLANGTIYERLPGKSQQVRDPLVLADLYRRGDTARQDAQARADRAALIVLDDWLGSDAGAFGRWVPPPGHSPDKVDDKVHTSFAVGVAATGNPPNISGRLFKDDFAEEVRTQLRDRPAGLPPGFRNEPDPVTWSQDALTWRHQVTGMLDGITIVRAARDGSVAVGQKLATEDVYLDSLAEHRIAPDWRYANQLAVERLGGFGDVYVTVLVTGGNFPRRKETGHIVMRRGPLLPGVDDQHVASLSRELMRAVGSPAPETD